VTGEEGKKPPRKTIRAEGISEEALWEKIQSDAGPPRCGEHLTSDLFKKQQEKDRSEGRAHLPGLSGTTEGVGEVRGVTAVRRRSRTIVDSGNALGTRNKTPPLEVTKQVPSNSWPTLVSRPEAGVNGRGGGGDYAVL